MRRDYEVARLVQSVGPSPVGRGEVTPFVRQWPREGAVRGRSEIGSDIDTYPPVTQDVCGSVPDGRRTVRQQQIKPARLQSLTSATAFFTDPVSVREDRYGASDRTDQPDNPTSVTRRVTGDQSSYDLRPVRLQQHGRECHCCKHGSDTTRQHFLQELVTAPHQGRWGERVNHAQRQPGFIQTT